MSCLFLIARRMWLHNGNTAGDAVHRFAIVYSKASLSSSSPHRHPHLLIANIALPLVVTSSSSSSSSIVCSIAIAITLVKGTIFMGLSSRAPQPFVL